MKKNDSCERKSQHFGRFSDLSRKKEGIFFSKELQSGFGCSLWFWTVLLEQQTNREGFSQCGLNDSWVMLAHSSFCLSEWTDGREELILFLSPSIFLKALGWDNASWAANFTAKTPGDTDQPLRPTMSVCHCGERWAPIDGVLMHFPIDSINSPMLLNWLSDSICLSRDNRRFISDLSLDTERMGAKKHRLITSHLPESESTLIRLQLGSAGFPLWVPNVIIPLSLSRLLLSLGEAEKRPEFQGR